MPGSHALSAIGHGWSSFGLLPFSTGLDSYPLVGWRWTNEDGQWLLVNQANTKCATTVEAFDVLMAEKGGGLDARKKLNILEKFLSDCCKETAKEDDEKHGAEGDGDDVQNTKPDRQKAPTTGPLDDYLWRGNDVVLKDMSWYVYSMWVYRIEKLEPKFKKDGEPAKKRKRFIDIPFDDGYSQHNTHLQRIATEFRVHLFEGFQMPPSTRDSETAAMYKALLLHPFSITPGTDDVNVRVSKSFDPLCLVKGEKTTDGNQADIPRRAAAASHSQKVHFFIGQNSRPRFPEREGSFFLERALLLKTLHDDLASGVGGCWSLVLGIHALLGDARGRDERLGRGSFQAFLGALRIHEPARDKRGVGPSQ